MLKELLETKGPCLSTDLTRTLVEDFGLSPEAARKRVSRGCPGLKRLAYLTFPRKARFLYLQRDYNSPAYWEALRHAIISSNSAYGPALAALMQRGGIIPMAHFPIVCGAPLRQKKHLSAEAILDRFNKANITKVIDVPGIGPCVALTEKIALQELDVNKLRARLITEGVLLKGIKMWVRHLGLASYDKVALRDDGQSPPQVGTFAWDLSGPSYLSPLMEWSHDRKPAPGFITCDILLGSEIDESGLNPFLHKCDTLKSLKHVGRCLQIFVADSYTPAAFRNAKTHGIVPATPETLFGSEVAQGLKQLTEVLTQAGKASFDPEVFDELFQRLGKIEGAAGNLRGALFEFVIAELVRHGISSNVTINKIIRDAEGAEAEVDVLAVQSNRAVYFIECKGHQPFGTVEDEEVERWLTKRIPLMRRFANLHPDWRNLKLHFELWTTGKISELALGRIQRAQAIPRSAKYAIHYRDAEAVRAFAKEANDKTLLKLLNQHFLEHPFSTAERDIEYRRARDETIRQRRLNAYAPTQNNNGEEGAV